MNIQSATTYPYIAVTRSSRKLSALLSFLLGASYLVFAIIRFSEFTGNPHVQSVAVGSVQTTLLVMPHLIVTLLAVLCCAFGYSFTSRSFLILSGILYGVSMLLMVTHLPMLVLLMACTFISASMPSQSYT